MVGMQPCSKTEVTMKFLIYYITQNVLSGPMQSSNNAFVQRESSH